VRAAFVTAGILIAVALGLTAAVVLGVGYFLSAATWSSAASVDPTSTTVDVPYIKPGPSFPPVSSTPPPLPLAKDIPSSWSADERSNAELWLAEQQITDACMSKAGFDEYYYVAQWQGDYFDPTLAYRWSYGMTPDRKAAALVALDGKTGGGADYHWQDAGCIGYSVHVMGQDNAN
jgi:hypothetical protein